MLKNLIILPDGSEVFSGNAQENAIISCAFSQLVNDGTELSIGSACCNELEVKLFAKNIVINANDEIKYYKVADNGSRTKIGVFRCEKPTVTGIGTYKFIAYDRVSWLDRDLTSWLVSLDGWPYSVENFARMVCEACGLTLTTTTLPNGDYQIRKFSGSGVTGRMLMQWLGQITCRFIRANTDGEIEFAWYSDKGKEITTRGELAYFGGGLSYEDFTVAKIQKVQIQVSDSDNGTVYPDGSEEELNTYKITGNYLLTAETGDELKPVAQTIFKQLQGVTYTPCKVSIQATTEINAGDIVHITDRNGVTITTYVMSKTNNGQKDTLECTGSYKRGSSTATNTLTMKALNGKVLDIKKDVDGLRIENKSLDGRVATIAASVESVSVEVSNISVGGRNLLKGTRDFRGFSVYPSGFISIEKNGDFSNAFFNEDIPEGDGLKYVTSSPNPIDLAEVLDQEVVFSFEIGSPDEFKSAGDNIIVEFAVCGAENTSRLRYKLFYIETDVPAVWKKHVIKAKLTEDFFSSGDGNFSDATRFWVRFYSNSGNMLYARKFKLELGNMATDWSANPEETEEGIASLKVTAQGISSEVKDAQGNITKLSQKADEQAILIESADGKATEALQKAGSIDQTYTWDDGGKLEIHIDGTGRCEAVYKDASGVEQSSAKFDLAAHVFRLNGDIVSQNKNSKLKVDDLGLTFSRSTGVGTEAYDSTAFKLALNEVLSKYYPSLFMGGRSNQDSSLYIRCYDNGIWIGNMYVPTDVSRFETPSEGGLGLFINTETGNVSLHTKETAKYAFEAVFA